MTYLLLIIEMCFKFINKQEFNYKFKHKYLFSSFCLLILFKKMISARTAGILAVMASLGSLIIVLFYIPALIVKITTINDQVNLNF